MRLITSVAAVALAATLVSVASWAPAMASGVTPGRSGQSSPSPSPAACYTVAVRDLRRHVVVRKLPPACAGLGQQQVNEAVARAIRTVVGPVPKAAARRLANAESRYLGSLVRQVPPPPAASPAVTAAAAASSWPARVAALVAWLAAAAAGARLLSRRLAHRRHQLSNSAVPLSIAVSHASVAAAGLFLWVAFLLTASPALGWIDVALTGVIVGLGMATLLADSPQGSTAIATAGGPAPAVPLPASRPPVLTIALHGALATVTIALVLTAVIGVG